MVVDTSNYGWQIIRLDISLALSYAISGPKGGILAWRGEEEEAISSRCDAE